MVSPVPSPCRHIDHERPVDFQNVEWKPAQALERSVSGPEVVDLQSHAQGFQPAQQAGHGIQIVHQDALGDLQLQRGRVQLRLRQDGGDLGMQIRLAELADGHIHADFERRQGGKLGLPPAHGDTRLPQHPKADGHDQPGLLRQRNKLVRRHDAALRMAPADQRFHAHDFVGLADSLSAGSTARIPGCPPRAADRFPVPGGPPPARASRRRRPRSAICRATWPCTWPCPRRAESPSACDSRRCRERCRYWRW